MVQSTLQFAARDRLGGNRLMPSDSGLYACIFENDVKQVDSTMNLRVERKYNARINAGNFLQNYECAVISV